MMRLVLLEEEKEIPELPLPQEMRMQLEGGQNCEIQMPVVE